MCCIILQDVNRSMQTWTKRYEMSRLCCAIISYVFFSQCPECGLLLKEHTSSEHVTLFPETIPVCRFMGDIQMHCSLCAQCHAVQSTWKFAESFFWALTAPLKCWLSRHKVNIFTISITINNHYNVRPPSSAERRSTDHTSNHLKAQKCSQLDWFYVW